MNIADKVKMEFEDAIRSAIKDGGKVVLENVTKGEKYALSYDYSDRQTAMILDGGLLNYTKKSGK